MRGPSIVGNRDRTRSACSFAGSVLSGAGARRATRGVVTRIDPTQPAAAHRRAAPGAVGRDPARGHGRRWIGLAITPTTDAAGQRRRHARLVTVVVAACVAAARAAQALLLLAAGFVVARAHRHRAPARLARRRPRAALVHRRLRGLRRLPGRRLLLGPSGGKAMVADEVMMRDLRSRVIVLVCCVRPRRRSAQAPPAKPPAPARPGPPRLVVLLVIDQFRADYVDLYGHQWTRRAAPAVRPGRRVSARAVPVRRHVTCAGTRRSARARCRPSHGMTSNTFYDQHARQGVAMHDRSDGDVGAVRRRQQARSITVPARIARRRSPTSSRLQATRPPHRLGRAEAALGDRPRRSRRTRHHRRLGRRRRHLGDVGRVHEDALAGRRRVRQGTPDCRGVRPDLDAPAAGARSYLFDDDAPGEGSPGGWTRTFPHKLESSKRQAGREFVTALGAVAAGATSTSWTWRRHLAGDAQARASSPAPTAGAQPAGARSRRARVRPAQPRSAGRAAAGRRAPRPAARQLDAGRPRTVRGRAFSADHGVAPIPEQAAALGTDAGRIVRQRDPAGRRDDDLEVPRRRHVLRPRSSTTSSRCRRARSTNCRRARARSRR